MYASYHMVILTLPAKYIGLALLLLFILVIYLKIYSFNKFMRKFVHLGLDYKKQPQETQRKYDEEIEIYVNKIMNQNILKKKKSKTPIEIPTE